MKTSLRRKSRWGYSTVCRAFVAVTDGTTADRIEASLSLQWPGCWVRRVARGMPVVDAIRRQDLDLVMIDESLLDTEDALAAIEIRRAVRIPLIALPAGDIDVQQFQRRTGGIDDYIVKPFSPIELVARVGSVLSRAASRPNGEEARAITADGVVHTIFDDGFLSFDLRSGQVSVGGRPIFLTQTELDLLALLIRSESEIVSDRTLASRVWGGTDRDASGYLAVHLRRLREMLEPDPLTPRYLLAKRGIGYRFVGGGHRPGRASRYLE